MQRSAGILLPIFSLPSPYGIGTMGREAREFVDFLSKCGQSYWQILPVGPTSYGDSPYQSFSSFAGNPYFIDLDDLCADGLLEREEYANLDWGDDPASIDYGLLYTTRYPVLRRAVRRLLAEPPADYAGFVADNGFWLEDYALFMALKDQNGGVSWREWRLPLRRRNPSAMKKVREKLAEEVAFWEGVQYLFFKQWDALKALANSKGISIIGDVPIYVSRDSADVWANPEQFQLDKNSDPVEVAGCPPDAFTEDGQLWGNPLFDWERMKKEGYAWWLRRIEFQFRICDMLRIDHFRGFDEYYAIPFGAVNARKGRWRPGPGLDFFKAVDKALGPRAIIAEDLGFLTDSVRQLLKDTGYPGMKILQFAFDGTNLDSDYLPHHYSPNCVVYAGTHDNDTIQGWAAVQQKKDALFARRYMRVTAREGWHWAMMRTAWGSVANLAVAQVQDLLGVGSEGRINTPSTVGQNWKWRLLPGQLTDQLARRVRREMAVYGRIPAVKKPAAPSKRSTDEKGEQTN